MNSKEFSQGLLLIFLSAFMPAIGCGVLDRYEPTREASQPQTSSQSTVASGRDAPSDTTPGENVTLDGYDASVGITVVKITLWKDYKNHAAGVSAIAAHGDGVKLLNRIGDDVLVETRGGKRGWVNSYFIKEFK